jgi:enoyl-CoA hydratase/carnithine racemase
MDEVVPESADPVVRYELDGPVAWLTIDRPAARNALSRAVREGLFAGIRRFNADATARVLVLTGSGSRAFCAGYDLVEMAAESLTVPPPNAIPEFGRNIDVEKPVVAAVNGAAFAGGFLLAQNCDLVVAASTATFAISEVKVGRGAPWAVPLPWLIPPRVAMELLLTGDPMSAQRAYEVGLVNRVVEPDQLHSEVQALAERIAGNAPLSVSAAKRTVRLAAEAGIEAGLDRAADLWRHVYLSADAQEGPSAFREHRRPVWTGR